MISMPFAGMTPLRVLANCSETFGCKVFGKLEIYNPTGSNKDRESQKIMRHAVRRRVRGLAIASTGNVAISLAAYSYIHGMECHVYIPRTIAPERSSQIRAYGPIISLADGYDNAIAECQAIAKRDGLLNCNLGARVEKTKGDSAIGDEIAMKQRWSYVVCPTNNGTLLAGVWRGLKRNRVRTKLVASVAKETRLAEGIAGFHRFEGEALSKAIKQSKGQIVEVSDHEISKAARPLASDGSIVEGAAAAAIAALRHVELSRKSSLLRNNGDRPQVSKRSQRTSKHGSFLRCIRESERKKSSFPGAN